MENKTPKRKVFLIYVLLVVATFVSYGRIYQNNFVDYDDTVYVTENQQVQAGLSFQNIVWAFMTTEGANWHPLTWLSHMLDCQLFGTEPGGHHFTSLVLHVINTLLLFAIFKQMTKNLWPSAFVAAAFALHPLHVDSVAWIAERKDVLSTLFWMLTLYGYTCYARRQTITGYLLTLLAFALGLMAKPMLVTLPFVLLLLDYWPLERLQAFGQRKILLRLITEKIPFFVLSVISCIITFIVQQGGGAVESLDKFAFKYRLGNALVSYIRYIEKTFWPNQLAVFYPHLRKALPVSWVIAAALLLVLITICVLWQLRRRRFLAVGWFWFIGTLIPVIGLVQVGSQSMADRYTYVSIIGLFIIPAWFLPDIIRKWKYKNIILGTALAAVIFSMMIRTFVQTGYWKNSYTLFSHALKVTDDNHVAHHGLGTALFKRDKFKDAIFHYNETLRIKPAHKNAHGDIGLALLQLARYKEAIGYFRQALNRKGQIQKWHGNLGAALYKTDKQKYLDKAIKHYRLALKLDNTDAMTHNNLAIALDHKGEFDKSVEHFSRALQLDPESPEYKKHLRIALEKQKKNTQEKN